MNLPQRVRKSASYQKAQQHLQGTGGIAVRPARFSGWSKPWAETRKMPGWTYPPGTANIDACLVRGKISYQFQ